MTERYVRLAITLGRLVQGVVLGVLLFLATAKLLQMATGAVIFRYQGF